MDQVKKTYVSIVLDRSRSMQVSRAATIAGINRQIATIRKDAIEGDKDHQVLVSFATFNHEYEPRYHNLSVNYLQDVTEENYVCAGDTAMLDAMGQAIFDLTASTDQSDPNNSYLLIVASDGAERCSRRFTRESVARLIRERQDTGRWTITYLGANQDLGSVTDDLNIPVGNVAKYASDVVGTITAWDETSCKLQGFLKSCRSHGGGSSVRSFHSGADGKSADYTGQVLPEPQDVSKWRKPKEN